ncbi:MAG: 5-deoxy-glucuronate isomerase [Actinomycetota bacterium]
MSLHYPVGTLADGRDKVLIDPSRAGWSYAGLRVFELPAGGSRRLAFESIEAAVVPLSGECVVDGPGYEFDLAHRRSVFEAMSDICYLPAGDEVVISTRQGVRVALATAVASERRSALFYAAADVRVEIRGAGPATRQVNPLLAASVDGPQRLIVVEVLAPGGNWSSYPPHKHDELTATEVPLEEIYYFEIRDIGGAGFGFHRTYTADGAIDETAVVGSGDVFLVPRGYHGPTVAAPGYDMYYLNVMAGPDPQRRWLISTDPAYDWLWNRWSTEPSDPRLPFYGQA